MVFKSTSVVNSTKKHDGNEQEIDGFVGMLKTAKNGVCGTHCVMTSLKVTNEGEIMFVLIFLCMLFCHIVDDFYLQGILAKMKQKSWWKEQTTEAMYEKDWLPALIAHGISWAFMIMFPCNIYLLIHKPDEIYLFSLTYIWNVWLHCRTDHLKCNKHEINLIVDQGIHVFQILVTFLVFFVLA